MRETILALFWPLSTGFQCSSGSIFKGLLLHFKALNGPALSYIPDLLTPYSTSRTLRSSNLELLAVWRTNFKLRGDHAFACAAPRLWNSIHNSIISAPSIVSFKSKAQNVLLFFSVWIHLK